jgi:hypothetical protein
MRRRSFRSNLVIGAVISVVLTAVGFLPAACDSTLDLGGLVDASALDAGEAGGGATCSGVCDKLIGCGYPGLPPRSTCISGCADMATQSLLDCIAGASCATIQSACGSQIPDSSVVVPPPFDSGVEAMYDINNCQEACDELLNDFKCIDASQQSSCRDLCVQSAKRNTFFSCVEGAGFDCDTGGDCLRVFEGD